MADNILSTIKEEITDKQSILTELLNNADEKIIFSGPGDTSDLCAVVKDESISEESDNEQLTEKVYYIKLPCKYIIVLIFNHCEESFNINIFTQLHFLICRLIVVYTLYF